MNDVTLYSGVIVLSVLVSSGSQILLKKAANRQHKSFWAQYLNARVIVAYALFLASACVSIFVLRYIPLSLAPILESSGYIFVMVLSFLFLCERLGLRQLAGMALIIAGIVIFTL